MNLPKQGKYSSLINLISALLILLFVYAAISKWMEFSQFRATMTRQPLPEWLAVVLVWMLPPAEIITSVLLAIKHTRFLGLHISLVLMILFTGYIALALSGVFGNIPCACGGVLTSLGWKEHLIFNVVFLLLAFAGTVLQEITEEKSLHQYTDQLKKNRSPQGGDRLR